MPRQWRSAPDAAITVRSISTCDEASAQLPKTNPRTGSKVQSRVSTGPVNPDGVPQNFVSSWRAFRPYSPGTAREHAPTAWHRSATFWLYVLGP